jgi:hypothetical protein
MQPYCGNIMSIKIPHLRKDTSTLFTIPAAIALLMLASPVSLLSNSLLLQPVQAQTTLSFKTPKPATFTDPSSGQESTLTFDAQGTATPSGPAAAKITSGTIQVNLPGSNGNGPQTLTGNITSGAYITGRSPPGIQFYATIQNTDFLVESACSTSEDNPIEVNPGPSSTSIPGEFSGAVECSPSQGGDTTAQPPSSLTGSSQGTDRGSSSNNTDSDRDGIPDSSDNCPNHPHHRCYKEGGDTNTTSSSTQQQQQQQQPSSSSSGSRNQTR